MFDQPTRTSVLLESPVTPVERLKFSTPAPAKASAMSAKKRELLLYLGGSAVALVVLGIAAHYVFFEQVSDIGIPPSTEQHAPAPQPPAAPSFGENNPIKDAPGSPTTPGTDAGSGGLPPPAVGRPNDIAGSSSPSTANSERMRVSRSASEGMLIDKVQPVYPPLARAAHVQGLVVLDARISKTGTVESLQLIQGHPLLAPAAIDAVKKWRYKPYMKNGKPISVETEIAVNFRLTSN